MVTGPRNLARDHLPKKAVEAATIEHQRTDRKADAADSVPVLKIAERKGNAASESSPPSFGRLVSMLGERSNTQAMPGLLM